MAPKKRPWFRFYVEAVSDRKLRRLKPEVRWLFVACLAAARQSPTPGVLLLAVDDPMSYKDLADFAGMNLRQVTTGIPALIGAGIICLDAGVLSVPSWDVRQFESDETAPRMAKHRHRDADVTADVTPPETEGREQRTESSSEPACDTTPEHEPVDDDPRIGEALTILAQADLQARIIAVPDDPIGDSDRWVAAARRKRLDVDYLPLRFLALTWPDSTAQDLVDRLQPVAPATPAESTVRASLALMASNQARLANEPARMDNHEGVEAARALREQLHPGPEAA